MIIINDETGEMVLHAADGTRLEARYSQDAAADGQGAWVIGATPYAARLFSRNEAITALSIEERLTGTTTRTCGPGRPNSTSNPRKPPPTARPASQMDKMIEKSIGGGMSGASGATRPRNFFQSSPPNRT